MGVQEAPLVTVMQSFLMGWLILSAAVWLTGLVLPGFYVRSFGGALLIAFLLGLCNFGVGALVLGPTGIAGLGIGALLAGRSIVNAVILQIVDAMTDQLEIDHFGWALGAGVMIGVISWAARVAIANI